MARYLALVLLAVSAGSLPVAAQDTCLQFLEEHPYDQACEKACLDYL